MAETEKNREEDGVQAPLLPEKPIKKSSTSKSQSSELFKPFAFWGYFTVAVSIVTLLFISLPRIQRTDHRSWFLTLPDDLRRHYSSGKLIKINSPSGGAQIQVFAVEIGPRESKTVLLLHGLGCSSYSFRRILRSLSVAGLRVVAVDLPGAGFSDELIFGNSANRGSLLGSISSVYEEIKEKGFFSGFDRLIETGEIQEKPARVSLDSGYGTVVMGQILGQIINAMDLAPIHLVLHDSALLAGSNWVLGNKGLVSSVTLMDASPQSAAFPSYLLNIPVLGHVLLGSKSVFAGLLRLCCARSVNGLDTEAYRLVLKRKNSGSAAAAWRSLNHSLNVGEWANSEELKNLPVQILWSNSLSDQWIDEGRRVAAEIPRAKFSFHSGGRWPQEDATEEISELIAKFVSSLPKSVRRMEEDTVPDHIQKMFDEASHQVHHHHDHSHGHNHEIPYMGMYGLDHG